MRLLRAAATVGLCLVGLAVGLEAALMAISQYRLTHGDGREASFRGRRSRIP
ncbi:MAG: hypothetical protein H0U16_06730 [Actinobacteria bacterium]|nr:hypothetical protein [Actinomycetota bacterium]